MQKRPLRPISPACGGGRARGAKGFASADHVRSRSGVRASSLGRLEQTDRIIAPRIRECPKIRLGETLADLLCAEGADAVEAEAEDGSVFVTQTDVEVVVLNGDGATVPGVAQGENRADERRASFGRPILKIEEERRAAEQPTIRIA